MQLIYFKFAVTLGHVEHIREWGKGAKSLIEAPRTFSILYGYRNLCHLFPAFREIPQHNLQGHTNYCYCPTFINLSSQSPQARCLCSA